MLLRGIKLKDKKHPKRQYCGWRHCKRPIRGDTQRVNENPRPAKYHVTFRLRSKDKRWHERLMGLCRIHRASFQRKYL